MSNRFNLYDLLGYILPGGLLVSVLFLCLAPSPSDATSFLGSVTLLFACYLVGHVLQTFSRLLFPTTPFSVQLMSPEGFPASLRLPLRKALIDSFKLESGPAAEGQTDPPEEDEVVQERFRLAYSFVVQRGLGGHVMIFNSLYAMYRGLLLSSIVSLPVLLAFSPSGSDWSKTLHSIALVANVFLLLPIATLKKVRTSSGVCTRAKALFARAGRRLKELGGNRDCRAWRVSVAALIAVAWRWVRGWPLQTPFGMRYIECSRLFAQEVYRCFYCAHKLPPNSGSR